MAELSGPAMAVSYFLRTPLCSYSFDTSTSRISALTPLRETRRGASAVYELRAATVHDWERLLAQVDMAKCCAITSSMAVCWLASTALLC